MTAAAAPASNTATLLPREDVRTWFTGQGWSVFPFQSEVWDACMAGDSGLLHAPTGNGKTYAAWFGALQSLPAPVRSDTAPLSVLWITPLRALALDTHETLARSIKELDLPLSLGLRTADTPSHVRAKQRKRLPSALVTTPESLELLLSYADTAKQFRHLKAVIVDEWHELLGNKRGVLLQLSLASLRERVPKLRVWGLSATIGNLQEAVDVLHGPPPMRQNAVCVVRGAASKVNNIAPIIPSQMTRFPWSGHMGLALLPEVIKRIEDANTTLLFANTRSQAERWYEALLTGRLDWIDKLALHHGSLERDHRIKVEDLLRNGRLKCVVATSTLDLGVDFSPVEQVIQVGSPKGVARLLQRAGRSGHQPGATSKVWCAPAHALELAEIAAARRAAALGQIESRRPLRLSLDVLAQHVVTMALAGDATPGQLLRQARSTHAFADLSDAAWAWVLDFVCRGGPALEVYPNYQRVSETTEGLRVPSRRIANQHRMNIGTITADSMMKVKFVKGGYLGMIEERFVAQLKPGDVFLFAGRSLELKRVRDMVAQVKAAPASRKTLVPRWAGGRLPLSTELADNVLALLDEAEQGRFDSDEMQALKPLLQWQQQSSALPGPNRLLIERCVSRDGISLFLYPFAGRLVHEGLAALLAWRISQQQAVTFRFSVNDYGLELLCNEELPFTEAYLRELLQEGDLTSDIRKAINASEMAKRQFRDIARIAGLVLQGFPGARKSTRQVQASSSLIYDVLVKHDPDNQLPQQAEREVLDAQFELARLRETLQRLHQKQWVLCEPEKLTPLGFPLWAERIGSQLSSESWQQRVQKMQQKLEQAAS